MKREKSAPPLGNLKGAPGSVSSNTKPRVRRNKESKGHRFRETTGYPSMPTRDTIAAMIIRISRNWNYFMAGAGSGEAKRRSRLIQPEGNAQFCKTFSQLEMEPISFKTGRISIKRAGKCQIENYHCTILGGDLEMASGADWKKSGRGGGKIQGTLFILLGNEEV